MGDQLADMDIDMLDTQDTTAVTDAELAALEQELAQHDAPPPPPPSDPNPTGTTVESTSNEPGSDIDSTHRPEAILLQGVDEMKTRDIRVYCQDLPLDKIEWINDTSCNLVFANAEVAKEAAEALLVNDVNDPLSATVLRKAKPFTDPKSERTHDLHIRMATKEDVKEKGSRDRSRFYLLYGEGTHDFDEFDAYEKARDRANNKQEGHEGGDGDDGSNGQQGGDILSRLGARRERKMRSDSQAAGKSVFERLGKRDESRPSRRPRDHHRRRSLSPRARPSPRQEEDDTPKELPESLKGRLGPKRS
ncbi:predicted protein [Lichtheimia corymbifera JMRC:FSU:9682]|uniref:Uncharacterized protein n=1 Tax=Lichtheimia corymbifera JMRC:FSU:9682 TaxID=1263082 RepID=A0A068S344_9FUNG|nr:predicted protein [Lichtheimia corymbifera JMRC:FSU:9682]